MINFRVISTMFFAILAMTAVYKFSRLPNKLANGFKRYDAATIKLFSSADLPTRLNFLVANAPACIYACTSTPGEIYTVDYSGRILNHNYFSLSKLQMKNRDDLVYPLIDPHHIYFLNFNNPNMVSGDLPSDSLYNSPIPGVEFTRAVLMDSNVLMVRRFNNENQDQKFSKYFLQDKKYEDEHNFSEIFHDGGLSTDGTLNYDSSKGVCTYVYYYKNKFIVFDKGLNFIKAVKTVDTFSNVQISVDRVDRSSAGSFTVTNNSPAYRFNTCSAVSNGRLYIASSVKADNETPVVFKENNVIDMYDIDRGVYTGSIYIPRHGYNGLSDFRVRNDTLIVLYEKSIKCFKLLSRT